MIGSLFKNHCVVERLPSQARPYPHWYSMIHYRISCVPSNRRTKDGDPRVSKSITSFINNSLREQNAQTQGKTEVERLH